MEQVATTETYKEGYPTVTIDRAVAHLVENIGLDLDALSQFYNHLPHPNKPPLGELHIHFSASNLESSRGEKTYRYGRYENTPEKSTLRSIPEVNFIPEGPMVVIYLGSIIRVVTLAASDISDKSTAVPSIVLEEYIQESVNDNLTHELVHYAQMDTTDPVESPDKTRKSVKSIAKKATLVSLYSFTTDRAWLQAGIPSATLSSIIGNIPARESLSIGLGTAALVYLARHRKRRNEKADAQFDSYLETPEEVEARNLSTRDSAVVTIGTLTGQIQPTLTRVTCYKNAGRFSLLAAGHRFTHRELSKEPQEICP